MISKWKYNYTDEEKGMALTIQSLKQEIGKLVDELEEQERHIKEANAEIERLHSIIKEVREYIEKHQCCDGKINIMTLTEYKELLEILKGEDKE